MQKNMVMPLFVFAMAAAAAPAFAEAPAGDAAYLAKIATAAPAAIVKAATIVATEKDGSTRTLQKGTNEFTCMTIPDGTPMCADRNGMEWMHALMHKAAPPDKVGFMYMLAGDTGTSNVVPGAAGPTADNHWIKTGPHVMILGPAVKQMVGYSRELDPNPATAYVMWRDTPYEHLMIPVR